jgi:predicted RNA-binding Zn-ribbon protein involved in translation (DUF1610 family)
MKFENGHEIEAFVDFLEKFINAVGIGRLNPAHLNKCRSDLEAFIKESCGLIEKPVDESVTYKCPECSSEMILRTNRESGNKFWGCTKYPQCRGTRDSSGLSKAERNVERAKIEEQQQTGFRFRKS